MRLSLILQIFDRMGVPMTDLPMSQYYQGTIRDVRLEVRYRKVRRPTRGEKYQFASFAYWMHGLQNTQYTVASLIKAIFPTAYGVFPLGRVLVWVEYRPRHYQVPRVVLCAGFSKGDSVFSTDDPDALRLFIASRNDSPLGHTRLALRDYLLEHAHPSLATVLVADVANVMERYMP